MARGLPSLIGRIDNTIRFCDDQPVNVGDIVQTPKHNFKVVKILARRKAQGEWIGDVPDFIEVEGEPTALQSTSLKQII